jgi:hypothetical protein
MTSNAAVRARQLAKPTWGIDGRTEKDYQGLFSEESHLNKTIDWTFDYKWQGQGNWGDFKTNEIKLPNAISQPIVFYH